MDLVWQTARGDDTGAMLFRGQTHDWPLLPKLFRHPNTPELVESNEQKMLNFLTETASHLRPSQPDNEWDWLSLGQHFGMSTRMSDWTENPLIGLFFAVEAGVREGEKPVVFQYPIPRDSIIRQKQAAPSPFSIDHTKVVKPNSHSIRSEAQAAWHVVHAIHSVGGSIKHFYPLAGMTPHDKLIKKILVQPEAVRSIHDELAKWGIDHATVYGDFASVCRSIPARFGLA